MNDPIVILPPLPVRLGLNHGSSNEGGKDEFLQPHVEQAPAFTNTASPAQHPGGAPFALKPGGK